MSAAIGANERSLPDSIRTRDVIRLAWPVMISSVSYSAMMLFDTFWASWLGTAATAAVGMGAAVSFLAMSFGWGLLGGGTRVAVAQRTGAGDRAGARGVLVAALWLCALCGALVIAVVPVGGHVFDVLGASEQVGRLATEYFGVRSLGAPLQFAAWALAGYRQGIGDTRSTMWSALVANSVDLVLGPILMLGLGPFSGMGVAGAGLAATFASLSQLIVLLIVTWPTIRSASCRIERDALAFLVRLGLPMAFQRTLDVVGFMAFVSVLARVSDQDLAAHVLVMRIVNVSFLPAFALAEAGSVLVGQAVGARRPQQAREAWRGTLWLAMGILSVSGVVFLILPDLLVWPFFAEPTVSSIAVTLLRIAALFQIFDAIATVSLLALSGAGDTRFTMITTVSATWLLNVPLGALLALGAGWGAAGSWTGLTVEIAAVALIAGLRIRGTRWLQTAYAPPEVRKPVPVAVPAA